VTSTQNLPSIEHLIAVVTVLHNSAAVVEECLASIPPTVEVIVVDNRSVDDSVERASRARADLTLVRSEFNLGFGAGCNLGWVQTDRPYIAFVNPDAVLERDTLSRMLQRLIAEPHGIVGPALLDERGTRRLAHRRPSVMVDFVHLLPGSRLLTRKSGWDGRLPPDSPIHLAGGPVGYVDGSCFMLRRLDLEAIGGFDNDLFLYCEEAILTMRLAALGGRAFYEPAALAHHSGAHSTGRTGPTAVSHYFRSRVVFYRKRDGLTRGGFAAVLLLVGAFIQWLTALTYASLHRRSDNTPETARAALRGVADGLTYFVPAHGARRPHRASGAA